MDIVKEIATAVAARGGRVMLVGGCVRDQLLGHAPKDVDVEVYGITPETLIEILGKFGPVDLVGRQFGVLKIRGIDLDVAMPRRENKISEGHKGFAVTVDPFMSFADACRRRDLTINAILMDALSGEVIDPYGGRADLERGVIRHVDPQTFPEDPLRVYRVAQFAARFGFRVDPRTENLCRGIDLGTLPKERIFEELSKMLLKGLQPSIGLKFFRRIGVIHKYYPELAALIDCPQPDKHHPEGDVWNHTLLVVDEAAKLRGKSGNPEALMFAALLHDIGKPSVTAVDARGKVTAHHHAEAGVPLAEAFMRRITNEGDLLKQVTTLVGAHMAPLELYRQGASDAAIRRLAARVNLEEVLLLSEADVRGRAVPEALRNFTPIRERIAGAAQRLGVTNGVEPLVKGRDLIALGLKPSPEFKKILARAFELQLEGASKETIIGTIIGAVREMAKV